MKSIIQKVPIPTAGVALGLVALGILLQPLSEVFHIVAGSLSFVMVLLLVAKIVLFPRMIREDLTNPIFAAVSAALFMTCMQLATYLAPVAFDAAFAIWVFSVLGHFALMGWFTYTFTMNFRLEQVFPTHFIAYVGIIVASLTSPVFGMELVGTAIFWFGFICYLALLVIVGLRYAKHEVPEAAKPLFCIYAAPMSLSLAGYLAVTPEPNAYLVGAMAVLAQAFLALVLSQLPKILRIKFYPSYAAMTFPFVIAASALLKAVTYFEGLGFSGPAFAAIHVLISIETIFASVMVLYVVGHYVRFFFRRVEGKPTELVLTSAEVARFAEEIGD
ncbi:TDT family transporter [Raoultibacter phocaeensis]|uniref:TDT family transporter n=1 Tax=Raoultibacter phocaeensis TaxID=2479841 RepID=UPI00111A92B7|nr:TDT family transporter [Raoultibacter phocaeensis]